MTRFTVTSGTCRATMYAEDAFAAAVEAVHYWGQQTGNDGRLRGGAELGDEIRVSSRETGARIERFATARLLAQANQQPLDAAWERLLREIVSRN